MKSNYRPLWISLAFTAPLLVYAAWTVLGYRSRFPTAVLADNLLQHVRWRWATIVLVVLLICAVVFFLFRTRLPSLKLALAMGIAFIFVVHFGGQAIGSIVVRHRSTGYLLNVWWPPAAILFVYACTVLVPLAPGPDAKFKDSSLAGRLSLVVAAAFGAAILGPLVWSLALRQFHPLWFFFGAPYLAAGAVFGACMAAMPASTYAGVQAQRAVNRLVLAAVLGMVSALAGTIAISFLGKWMTWGNTADYLVSIFTHGVLIDSNLLLLSMGLGLVCGPILWWLLARLRGAELVRE